MGEAKLFSFPDPATLASAVAEYWIEWVSTSYPDDGKLRVALSGGRIMTEFLAATVKRAGERFELFDGMEFFWADERCVPPQHPDSNFRLADERFFQPMRIAASAIHRICGECDPPAAAQDAAVELCRVAGQQDLAEIPVLDLILLGMGEDGHIASLFPGDASAAADLDSIYRVVSDSPKPPLQRITLGYGPIAAAQEVWVLASGPGKSAALAESMTPDGRTPLASVIRLRSQTRVYSDIKLS
jgi:6-phosphogluconolactonase